MAVVRRTTDKDATWARAWTADTAAELSAIPGPRRGDEAYATDTGLYYRWHDNDTWVAFAAAIHTHTAANVTDFSTAADARIAAAVGVSVQAYSANLTTYASIAPTAAGLALLDDADAAAQLTTLGLGLSIGTWTPAITFGGAAVGMTYSTQTGQYIKIGRLVWLEASIALSAKGSSTGNAKVNLPFTPDTNVSAVIEGTAALTSVTDDVNICNWGSGPGSASLDIRQGGRKGSAPTWLTEANFNNSTYIYFTCMFRTA